MGISKITAIVCIAFADSAVLCAIHPCIPISIIRGTYNGRGQCVTCNLCLRVAAEIDTTPVCGITLQAVVHRVCQGAEIRGQINMQSWHTHEIIILDKNTIPVDVAVSIDIRGDIRIVARRPQPPPAITLISSPCMGIIACLNPAAGRRCTILLTKAILWICGFPNRQQIHVIPSIIPTFCIVLWVILISHILRHYGCLFTAAEGCPIEFSVQPASESAVFPRNKRICIVIIFTVQPLICR